METKIKHQILLKFVYFMFNFLIIGKRERRQKCYLIYTEFQWTGVLQRWTQFFAYVSFFM